jgi:hypothetical protein
MILIEATVSNGGQSSSVCEDYLDLNSIQHFKNNRRKKFGKLDTR